MKKTMIALLLLSSCLFAACGDDDEEWDVAPIVYYFTLQDAQGHDLLDPQYSGNVLGRIYVEYNGEDYLPSDVHSVTLRQNMPARSGRQAVRKAYMSVFYGLYHDRIATWDTYELGLYCLCFGEFAGDANEKSELELYIDGQEPAMLNGQPVPAVPSVATFGYTNSYKETSKGSPVITRYFYFNGDRQTEGHAYRGMFHLVYDEQSGISLNNQ